MPATQEVSPSPRFGGRLAGSGAEKFSYVRVHGRNVEPEAPRQPMSELSRIACQRTREFRVGTSVKLPASTQRDVIWSWRAGWRVPGRWTFGVTQANTR